MQRIRANKNLAKGFSLIELLIVVAIILIIAAIAIPNLMRARMAANDSSAAASERTTVTGEIGYFAAYPTVGYTSAWLALGGASPCTPAPATGCLIDNNLATDGAGGGKSGYKFTAATQSLALAARFRTSSGPPELRSALRLAPRRTARSMTAWFARSPRAPSPLSPATPLARPCCRWRISFSSLAKYLGEGTSREAAKATSLLFFSFGTLP